MKIPKNIKIALSLLASTTVLNSSLRASELRNRIIFFEKSPRLLQAYSTFSDTRVWGAKYYFTLYVPENAGEPLRKVTIEQRQGQEKIDFRVEETLAFVGKPDRKQAEIEIVEIERNEENQTISLIFDPPIEPGTTFSVGLKPKKNPQYGGVYIFGVTAYPEGSQSQGAYLGIGRFHFYDNGDDGVR